MASSLSLNPTDSLSLPQATIDLSDVANGYAPLNIAHIIETIRELLTQCEAALDDVILCGFDGLNEPRIAGTTFGTDISILQAYDYSDSSSPLFYALEAQAPRLAIYDKRKLEDANAACIYRIAEPAALLAVIKILV